MRVLLEGPQIEPLLAQVRREYGPAAKIISAEKVRTGGLGGFFARQRFELAVEVGDEPATGDEAGGEGDAAAPRSLEELLDLAEAREGGLSTPANPATAASTPVGGAARAATANGTANSGGSGSGSGSGSGVPAAGTFGNGAAAVANGNGAAVTATTGSAMVPRGGLVSTNGPAFAEVMASLTTVSTPPAELTGTVRPYRPPVVTTAGPLTGALTALGVPERMAARAASADPYQAVLQAVATMPPAPAAPTRPGDVLVVVGELAHALPIARGAAEEMRLDPARLLVAAASTAGTGLHHSRRISGAAEARRRARTMHRDDVPHVVVIDAPIGAADDGWVREICAELGATAVWAAVDGTRKIADTAAHLRRIGPVTAIALYATAATADPAAPLALGQPVALIDGRPATPHAWAALLTERLGDADPTGE